MKKNRIIALGLTLSLTATLLSGCGTTGDSGSGTDGGADLSANETIKIGLSAPITGANAEMGKGFQTAMEIAIEEINEAGGIGGKPIEMEVMDSKGDAKEASEIAKKFTADDSMLMVVGDYSTTACMAAAPIYGDVGMVLMSPSASNPQFSRTNEYMFTLGGRSDTEPKFNLTYLIGKYLGFDTVAAVYVNNDWGVSVKDTYLPYAEENGFTVTACEPINPGEKDFAAVITKLRQGNPQAVNVIAQSTDAAHFIKQLRQLGWDVPISISGGAYGQQLLDLGGEDLNGCYITSNFYVDEDDERGNAFLDEFYSRAGFEASMNVVSAYDAVYIIKDACDRLLADGKELTRANFRDYLATTTDFEGISVSFTFSEDRDFGKRHMILQVEDGQFVKREGFEYGQT